jgi:hypothetical protein
VPALLRPRVRTLAFHFISQLGIRYRNSPAVREGEPRLRLGPRAGDRLPDVRVEAGSVTSLHHLVRSPHVHLLLCGPVAAWDAHRITDLRQRFSGLLMVSHLSRDNDPDGRAFAALGVEEAAQYVVRPDGHIAFRCGGTDLDRAAAYLDDCFASTSTASRDESSSVDADH